MKNNDYHSYSDVFTYYSDEHIFEFFYEESDLIYQECNDILLNFIKNKYPDLDILYINSKKDIFYIGTFLNSNCVTSTEELTHQGSGQSTIRRFCKMYKLTRPVLLN